MLVAAMLQVLEGDLVVAPRVSKYSVWWYIVPKELFQLQLRCFNVQQPHVGVVSLGIEI